mgnify:CR=1 FL=1
MITSRYHLACVYHTNENRTENVFNDEQKIAIDADNDLDISELDPKAKESVKKHIEKSAENVIFC